MRTRALPVSQASVSASATRPVDRTAEWNCTRCGVTNRKLVPHNATVAMDRCVHCGLRHRLHPGERPVRWVAEAV